jgi:DNA uptake protein ComE-like DNA-binding protein
MTMNTMRTMRAIAGAAAALLLSAGMLTAQTTTARTQAKTPSTKSSGARAGTSHHAARAALVDVNSATKDQLMALPGMTDDEASKIIAGRPYKTKNELTKKGILPNAEYRKIAARITVKTAKA